MTDETNGDGAGKKGYFDYDSYWKSLIEKYFYQLLKKAVPELYKRADTGKPPKFLSKEFKDILNTGDPKIHKHPNFTDEIAEVPLKGGDTECVLFHAEAQGSGGGDLAERMHHYECLIYAHFRKEPAALAIITDRRPKNEAMFYSHSRFGTKLVYEYNNLVLLNLDDGELLSSENPIDIALYAAKQAALNKEEYRRYTYLRELAKILGDRGWDGEEKRNLILFVERILYIADENLRAQYWEYRDHLDREGKIVYEHWMKEVEEQMAEKRGEARGEAIGEARGEAKAKAEMARNLLASGISPDLIAQSAGLPLEQVQSLMN